MKYLGWGLRLLDALPYGGEPIIIQVPYKNAQKVMAYILLSDIKARASRAFSIFSAPKNQRTLKDGIQGLKDVLLYSDFGSEHTH